MKAGSFFKFDSIFLGKKKMIFKNAKNK